MKQAIQLEVNFGCMPEVKVRFNGGDDPMLNDPTRINVFQCMASSMVQSAINEDEAGNKLINVVNSTNDPTGGMFQVQLMQWVSEICIAVCDAVMGPGYLEEQREFMEAFTRKAPELKQKFQDAADELGRKLEAMAGGEG